MKGLDLSSAWGYGAVVVPARLFWQEFIIPDPETKVMQAGIVNMENIAKFAYHAADEIPNENQVYGALQATLVECLVGEADVAEGRIGVLAAAVAKRAGKFWVIDATLDEKGTFTTVAPLDVSERRGRARRDQQPGNAAEDGACATAYGSEAMNAEKVTLPDGRVVDEKLYRERFMHAPAVRGYFAESMQPCKYCLRPAFKCTPEGETQSRPTQCDGCYEVTSRLEGFLRDGVKNPDDVPATHDFVITALVALGYNVSQ